MQEDITSDLLVAPGCKPCLQRQAESATTHDVMLCCIGLSFVFDFQCVVGVTQQLLLLLFCSTALMLVMCASVRCANLSC